MSFPLVLPYKPLILTTTSGPPKRLCPLESSFAVSVKPVAFTCQGSDRAGLIAANGISSEQGQQQPLESSWWLAYVSV